METLRTTKVPCICGGLKHDAVTVTSTATDNKQIFFHASLVYTRTTSMTDALIGPLWPALIFIADFHSACTYIWLAVASPFFSWHSHINNTITTLNNSHHIAIQQLTFSRTNGHEN